MPQQSIAPHQEDEIRRLHLIDPKRSAGSIAKEVGVSEATVRRRFRTIDAEPVTSGTSRACDGQSVSSVTSVTSGDLTRQDIGIIAKADLQSLRTAIKEGLDSVHKIEDEHQRTWAKIQYIREYRALTVMEGRWAGLENAEPEPVAVSPLDTFSVNMREYQDKEHEGER